MTTIFQRHTYISARFPVYVSLHTRQNDGLETIYERQYDSSSFKNFSIYLIESISEFLGVDPTKTRINLCEHIDLESVDKAFRYHSDDLECINTTFPYGDYTISFCACGTITIKANQEDHENGNTRLPDSMRLDN